MKRTLAALVLVLAACSSEADLEPKSGVWNYNGSTLGMNTCGENTPTDAAGPFTLTVTGEGTFTINDDDFMNAFECTYEGDSFSCPKRIAGSNKPEASIDATLFYNVSITGTLDSETELSGTQTVDLSCEGTSCGLAVPLFFPQLPCAYNFTFSADIKA